LRLVAGKGVRRRQPAPLQSERNPSVLFKGRWYYVRVTGKGNVTRDAPFPIDLVRDLITIGIWDVRMRQLQRWSNTAPPPGPPRMFLSEKTRKGLKTKPIGNLAKNAFNACKVEGSGHRLRAYFATNLAQRLWATCFTDNMFRRDQTVENRVLVDLAQALGHASPTTARRHYRDLGRAAYFHLGNKSQLKAMRMACEAMATHRRRITPEFFRKWLD
jgi:integrase